MSQYGHAVQWAHPDLAADEDVVVAGIRATADVHPLLRAGSDSILLDRIGAYRDREFQRRVAALSGCELKSYQPRLAPKNRPLRYRALPKVY